MATSLIESAVSAIVHSFDRDEMRVAMKTGLELDFDTLVANKPFDHQVFDLILRAQHDGTLIRLLNCLIHYRPNSQELADVYEVAKVSVPRKPSALAELAPFEAPDPPAYFLGREDEFTTLCTWLRSEEQSVIVIRGGVGGIGKSALAAYTAHKLRDEFSAGVLWASLDTESTLSILESFIVAFEGKGDVLFHLTSVESRAKYYRRLVSRRRCLVILDNAENPSQVLPLLPFGPSKVLITTRFGLDYGQVNVTELHLQSLSDGSAQMLMSRYLGSQPRHTPELLDRLCSALGNLPLAIRIAASNIRELRWSIEEYLQHLLSSLPLDWLDTDGRASGIRSSFAVSYANLPNESLQRTFRVLGAVRQMHSLASLLAHVLETSLPEANRKLLFLVRMGLIEVVQSTPGSYEMHPLMSYYAEELLKHSGEWQSVHIAAGAYHRSHLSRWDAAGKRFVYDKLANAADLKEGLLAISHFFEAECYIDAQSVLASIADQFALQGNNAVLFSWLKKLSSVSELTAWLQLYQGNLMLDSSSPLEHGNAVRTLKNLAETSDLKLASAALIRLAEVEFVARNFGRAKELLHKSQEIKQMMQPPDEKGLAFIQNELARIGLYNRLSPLEVLEMHGKALRIQEDINDSRGRSYTLRKMAVLYLHNLDNPEKAEELLGLSEKLAVDSDDHVGQIHIAVAKSTILARRQYYSDAVEILDTARQVAFDHRNLLGEVLVLMSLARLYEKVELFGQAFDAITRCHEILDLTKSRAETAAECERILERLSEKLATLRSQLEKTEMLEAQAQNNVERRVLRRQRKRLRQKLGLEPGLIRLGERRTLW